MIDNKWQENSGIFPSISGDHYCVNWLLTSFPGLPMFSMLCEKNRECWNAEWPGNKVKVNNTKSESMSPIHMLHCDAIHWVLQDKKFNLIWQFKTVRFGYGSYNPNCKLTFSVNLNLYTRTFLIVRPNLCSTGCISLLALGKESLVQCTALKFVDRRYVGNSFL